MQESEQNKQTTREVSVNSFTENLGDRPVKKKAKFVKEEVQLSRVAKDHFVSSSKPVKEQEQESVPLPLSAKSNIPLSSFPTVNSETEKR